MLAHMDQHWVSPEALDALRADIADERFDHVANSWREKIDALFVPYLAEPTQADEPAEWSFLNRVAAEFASARGELLQELSAVLATSEHANLVFRQQIERYQRQLWQSDGPLASHDVVRLHQALDIQVSTIELVESCWMSAPLSANFGLVEATFFHGLRLDTALLALALVMHGEVPQANQERIAFLVRAVEETAQTQRSAVRKTITSEWKRAAYWQLRKIRELDDTWNGPDSTLPKQESLERVTTLLHTVGEDFPGPFPRLAPLPPGHIAATWTTPRRRLETEFETATYGLLAEQDGKVVTDEETSDPQRVLDWIAWTVASDHQGGE